MALYFAKARSRHEPMKCRRLLDRYCRRNMLGSTSTVTSTPLLLLLLLLPLLVRNFPMPCATATNGE
jgi:hypothetical protein